MSFTKTGPKTTLNIQDDGVGLPDGLDIVSPERLGLKLVRRLTRQLGGTFSIESQGGN
jgi:two-component system, sensor histidine kinase PdtaS